MASRACPKPSRVSASTVAVKLDPSSQLTVTSVRPELATGSAVAKVSTMTAARVRVTRLICPPSDVGTPTRSLARRPFEQATLPTRCANYRWVYGGVIEVTPRA